MAKKLNMKVTNSSNITQEMTAEDLKKLAGTDARAFAEEIIRMTSLLSRSSLNTTEEENQYAKSLARSMMVELAPQDGLQGMIASQMIAVHHMQQKFSFVARNMYHPNHVKPYVNVVTKLSNVFIQQAQLLTKLQGKNQQRVSVEHVTVNEGGQAIVGNITRQPGVKKNE